MVPSSNGSPPGVPAVPNPCRGRRQTGFWLLLAWRLSPRPDSAVHLLQPGTRVPPPHLCLRLSPIPPATASARSGVPQKLYSTSPITPAHLTSLSIGKGICSAKATLLDLRHHREPRPSESSSSAHLSVKWLKG